MSGARKTKERLGTKAAVFGKRRRDGLAPVARKRTSMDWLKALSRRWWNAKHRQEKPRPARKRG
jgi:hypothetical protein